MRHPPHMAYCTASSTWTTSWEAELSVIAILHVVTHLTPNPTLMNTNLMRVCALQSHAIMTMYMKIASLHERTASYLGLINGDTWVCRLSKRHAMSLQSCTANTVFMVNSRKQYKLPYMVKEHLRPLCVCVCVHQLTTCVCVHVYVCESN